MKKLTACIALFAFPAFIFAQPGTLDTTFSRDGKASATIENANATGWSLLILSSGKLLAAGSAFTDSTSDFALMRFRSAGSPDASFGVEGRIVTDLGGIDNGRAVAVQADGKILIAGTSNICGSQDFALVRYNKDGTPDSSFGTGGKVFTDFYGFADECSAMLLQPDEKIVVAGSAVNMMGQSTFAVARYNTDGSPDTTFGNDGKAAAGILANDYGYAVAIQPDGKIIVAGIANAEIGLVRFDTDGSPDNTFGTNGRVHTFISGDVSGFSQGNSVAVLASGKILVAGSVRMFFSSSVDFALVRYRSNGLPDSAFGTDAKVITDFGNDDYGNALRVQADGKIIVAGTTYSNTVSDFALVRYRPNGAPDRYFGAQGKVITGLGENNSGNSLAIQPDGKIVVGGYCVSKAKWKFAVARYYGNDTAVGLGKDSSPEFKKIAETEAYFKIKISPNPAKDVLYLSGLDATVPAAAYIIDMQGKTLREKIIAGNSSAINIQSLLPGIFFLRIKQKNKEAVIRFFKE